jgi:chromosome segregation ATPase
MIELQDATGVTQYRLVQELDELKVEAESLAGDNTVLADSVNSVFSYYKSGLSDTLGNISNWREAWFEALNDTQKESLSNIDNMKSALQSVMNGEGISRDTFWKLAEFDTDHILDGVKMIGDQFYLTEEQAIALKDAYIQKQIESLEIEQKRLEVSKLAAQREASDYQTELSRVQKELENFGSINSEADGRRYAELNKRQKELQGLIKTATDSAEQYGEQWSLNAILLRQYNADLGNTSDLIQAAQAQADKLNTAFIGQIDNAIDIISEEKDALTEEKEVLQDQLDILEAQADEIKGIIEDYEKVADVVKNTIQDEISAIEESYNKQIEALKAQNEEREEAINLTEKLNNLNNAKNNKVVTYTEAGGFQYGVNKEAVNKAQQEYDKALIDSQIAKLEKERDSATAGFEEYAKLWENATKKATKAEEEELAARILGADWREKIGEQDVEIFETYEQKYDEYGVSLNNITNIEIANVKKSIEAKEKEIKAKEESLKEWQKYKDSVQKWVNELKSANDSYSDSIKGITLTESSNLNERMENFKNFKTQYMAYMEEIAAEQEKISNLDMNTNFDDTAMNKMIDGIGQLADLFDSITGESSTRTINSDADARYYLKNESRSMNWDEAAYIKQKLKDLLESLGGAAEGGSFNYTGMLNIHGTKQKSEVMFNAEQGRRLYDMVRTDNFADLVANKALTGFKIAQNRISPMAGKSSTPINITGTTINLPNVRDPQQFAREMERYLQTTLTESQIIPPRS